MTKTDLMNQIQQEVLTLSVSPLFEYRTANNYIPVIGEGSLDAEIIFVGEAPGRNEASSGRPFCGAAGRVLDTLLEHVKIPRESIYITNIVKDRPQENRDPTIREIELYGPFLDRQIEIIKPRVIATLGRYSMGYIMGKFGLGSSIISISEAHGKSYSTETSYGKIEIVVLYHPCVAVYNPHKINELKKDIEILGIKNA